MKFKRGGCIFKRNTRFLAIKLSGVQFVEGSGMDYVPYILQKITFSYLPDKAPKIEFIVHNFKLI